jgi:uncharacterized protein YfiM (DUF2279 family)
MSMDASGAFGGAMVFGKWKGRPTVRQLVTPSNPATAGQVLVRNELRLTGAAQHFAKSNLLHGAGRLVTDKAAIMAVTPAGYAWNGHLVKTIVGAGGVNYTAASAAYAALTGPQQAAWDAAAGGLVPPIPAVAQKVAGNGAGVALSAGRVFFTYEYALFLLGIAAAPGAVPPVYA